MNFVLHVGSLVQVPSKHAVTLSWVGEWLQCSFFDVDSERDTTRSSLASFISKHNKDYESSKRYISEECKGGGGMAQG